MFNMSLHCEAGSEASEFLSLYWYTATDIWPGIKSKQGPSLLSLYLSSPAVLEK